MILDNTLVFSDSQAITATAASANVVDLGATGTPWGSSNAVKRDIGVANEIPIMLTVVQAFNNLTSLTVSLEVATDAAFTTPVQVAQGPAIPLASLTAGTPIGFPAEFPVGTNLEFVRLKYTVVGTAPTTGKITAAVVAGRQAGY